MILINIRKFTIASLVLAMGGGIAAEAAPPNGYTYSVVATLGTLAPPVKDGIYHEGISSRATSTPVATSRSHPIWPRAIT